MARKTVLGRGLASLLPEADAAMAPPEPTTQDVYLEVSPDLIDANRDQPRTEFVEDRLKELMESIRSNGILQPLVVRRGERSRFELVAGERRLRSARRLKLKTVPVLIRQADDRDMLELALIENIQRDELNSIELALAFQNLKERFGHSHEEISRRVGKDRTTITNHLRLLNLPDLVQRSVADGAISMGHARALVGLGSEQEILICHERILEKGLSVRDTEKLVRDAKQKKKAKLPKQEPLLSPEVKRVTERLMRSLSTEVALVRKGKKGHIRIEYASEDELNRILDQLLS